MNVEPELQVSQIVGEATISRKPDFLLGVELAAFLKGDTGAKADELAYTLLEQSFQGTIPNPQILSYLKYSIRAEIISCSSIFAALTTFKKQTSPEILNCLLLILRQLLNQLVSTKCDDAPGPLAGSLVRLGGWALNALNRTIQSCSEQPELWSHQHTHQNMALLVYLLQKLCQENKAACLLYVAAIAEPESWAQLQEEFTALVQVIQHLRGDGLPLRAQITTCLKDVKDSLLDHPPAKMKRLLSKNMDSTFDSSQRLVLEIFLSHRHSPLFINATAETCYKLIHELAACLSLGEEETIEALVAVGIRALSHSTDRSRWVTLMYIRVPQLLQLMASPRLFQVLGRYFRQNEIHIGQNQQLKQCLEGFIESLVQHKLLSQAEAATLPIGAQQSQSDSFHQVVAANQYFEKMLRESQKIVQLFEKQPCADPSLLIHIAGATGKLSNLTFALLNASQVDHAKDTIFGTAFLLLWKMVFIYGKAAVFKDIQAQNFHLATWFENNFPEDRLSRTNLTHDDVTPQEVEEMLRKAADPPKKGSDHLGPPQHVIKVAPKMVEMLLKAKAAGAGLDDDKMATILMTLRDHSRAGFLASYARLLQLALCGESMVQKLAQYYLVVYQQSKYKSKQTQMLITANCEDMLCEVFCVERDFEFTLESIKNKFDELANSHPKPTEEVGQILNEILMSQTVTQAELNHLAWLVDSIGIELFTRLLSNFIYQQRRRDLTELACNIAIGLSGIDWVGIPLALIWYQLPEVLSSVECSTTAEPFARFLATQLHFVIILQSHQNQLALPLTKAASQMFHQVAGNERRHFHGRNSELRRMLNSDSSSDWKLLKQIQKVVTTGGLESLATFKQQGTDHADQSHFTRCFHALGRTLFLAMAEAGQSAPVDFCLSLLDHIIKKGLNQQSNHTESIIQYFPWPLLNQLLQISGVESRISAILLASIDPSIPMLRNKVSAMIALAERRNS